MKNVQNCYSLTWTMHSYGEYIKVYAQVGLKNIIGY